MKNNLSERLISSLWLSLLGFFFVYNLQLFSPLPKFNLFFFCALASGFYFLFGFFRGYKVLKLPASQLHIFPLRCVAGALFSILMGILTWVIVSEIFNYFTPNQLSQRNFIVLLTILLSVVVSIAFLIGWFFLYRLLLLPKVAYLKEFPEYRHRIISAIWFGIIGYILAFLFHKIMPVMSIFILLLTSYFGYTVGYRILLLPSSIKGVLKSILIGFIWSLYALFIVWLMYIISFVFLGGGSKSVDFVENLGASIAFLFIFYLIAFLYICIPTTAFSVILYLCSRIGKQ